MQNEFVEDIIVKGRKDRNAPSPVTYEPAKTFGKTGIHFSVPGKFDRWSNVRCETIDQLTSKSILYYYRISS